LAVKKIVILQGFVNTEELTQSSETNLSSRRVMSNLTPSKLNDLKFSTSNLSCHHNFAVTNRDAHFDLFNIVQTLRRVAIVPTSSTVTNPDIFRETLIFGGGRKSHLGSYSFLVTVTVIIISGLIMAVSGYFLLKF
jgi:hypothetical protein